MVWELGKEIDMLVRQTATKLNVKRGERYNDTMGLVRRPADDMRYITQRVRGYKKTVYIRKILAEAFK